MATPVDVSLLAKLAPIFVFLVVFFGIYAVLSKIKILGVSKEINLVVSFVLGVIFMFTPGVSNVVILVTPWLVILFLMIIVIVTLFLFVGVKESTVSKVFEESGVAWFLIIVVIIIFGFVLSQVYGPLIQQYTADGQPIEKQGVTYDIAKIIFNSKILTVALILVIAAQSIRLIAKNY